MSRHSMFTDPIQIKSSIKAESKNQKVDETKIDNSKELISSLAVARSVKV